MNENQLREEFKKVMTEKFENGYEDYIRQEGIPENLAPKDVLSKVVAEQVDSGFDEFWEEEKNTIEENAYEDAIRQYINENYDSDYIFMQFEKNVDTDSITTALREDLVLSLINTEPYGYVARSYWSSKATQVDSLKELSEYTYGENLDEFVMSYAPDWEEVKKEN